MKKFVNPTFQKRCAWASSTAAAHMVRGTISAIYLSAFPFKPYFSDEVCISPPLDRSRYRPSEFHGPSLVGSWHNNPFSHRSLVKDAFASKSVPLLLNRVPFLTPKLLTHGLFAILDPS